MSTTVEVFVDYVCPFCSLAEDAVAELQRERDVQIEIRPFELRPDPVPTLRPEEEYLPRIWNGSVYPMARRLGADIRLPSVFSAAEDGQGVHGPAAGERARLGPGVFLGDVQRVLPARPQHR